MPADRQEQIANIACDPPNIRAARAGRVLSNLDQPPGLDLGGTPSWRPICLSDL
jgi:hypothetical protein